MDWFSVLGFTEHGRRRARMSRFELTDARGRLDRHLLTQGGYAGNVDP